MNNLLRKKINQNKKVVVGCFGAPHGVVGHIKVHSFTVPKKNICEYLPWYIESNAVFSQLDIKIIHNSTNSIVVAITDYKDRDIVKKFTNKLIYVSRANLPLLNNNEFYWSDLIGLDVKTQDNELLGTVENIFETGANDVLIAKNQNKTISIPYLMGSVIIKIDVENNTIFVNKENIIYS